jgi:hypothetical protein
VIFVISPVTVREAPESWNIGAEDWVVYSLEVKLSRESDLKGIIVEGSIIAHMKPGDVVSLLKLLA